MAGVNEWTPSSSDLTPGKRRGCGRPRTFHGESGDESENVEEVAGRREGGRANITCGDETL